MKHTFKYLMAFVLVFSLNSCKKEKLPNLPDENGPYYHIEGLVNDDSINWEVGVNETWLSYGQAAVNGVESFYGQITSGINGDVIRIEIVRPEIYSNGTEISSFTDANLTYLVHEPGAVKFNFGMNYEQFNYVLIKNNLDLFESANQVEFAEFGSYNLTVKFSDYSLSESFLVPIKFGFEDQLLNTGFTSHGEGDTLFLEPLTLQGQHSWYIDDVLVSSDAAASAQLNDGIYKVKHLFKDVYGNEGNYTTLVRFKNGMYQWQMKYYYIPPNEPSSHYGNVMVSMKKDGVWYSSTMSETNLGHKFAVSNISTEINIGQGSGKTAFDFIFRSILFNEDQSDSLYLPEMTGRMAVEFN